MCELSAYAPSTKQQMDRQTVFVFLNQRKSVNLSGNVAQAALATIEKQSNSIERRTLLRHGSFTRRLLITSESTESWPGASPRCETLQFSVFCLHRRQSMATRVSRVD